MKFGIGDYFIISTYNHNGIYYVVDVFDGIDDKYISFINTEDESQYDTTTLSYLEENAMPY